MLKIKFDNKQNVESYDINENDTSIKIETIKVETTNDVIQKRSSKRVTRLFCKKIRKKLINEIKMLIIIRLLYW